MHCHCALWQGVPQALSGEAPRPPRRLLGGNSEAVVTTLGMAPTISGTHLLDPAIIAQPYGFNEALRAEAPVWDVPGTGIFTLATYQLLAEAAARVEDFRRI
jgi:hypothetical protein